MKAFSHKHKIALPILTVLLLLASFQNCSKVSVSDLGSGEKAQGDNDNNNNNANTDDPPPPPPDGEDPPGDNNPRPVVQNALLKADQSPLDIVLAIDNSKSMETDSTHLAGKLMSFVKALEASSIDWQMCLIKTDFDTTMGRPQTWNNGQKILNKKTSSLNDVFVKTISGLGYGGEGTSDERGIAALSKNLSNRATNNCYRSGSVVTTIVISDEDERSVGGRRDLYEGMVSDYFLNDQTKELEPIDLPENYVSQFQKAFPSGKLISNSIVVQSGDRACFDTQSRQAPAFYGRQYELLSTLTQGKVGNICDSDYGPTLSKFATEIKKAFKDVELECTPLAGSLEVTNESDLALKWALNGHIISFETELAEDLPVKISYLCEK